MEEVEEEKEKEKLKYQGGKAHQERSTHTLKTWQITEEALHLSAE